MTIEWPGILDEILRSEFVTDFIQDTLTDIRSGALAFNDIPYGFGPDCYYKDQRALIEDAITQFLDEGWDDIKAAPKLVAWICQEVKERLGEEISYIEPTNLTDFEGNEAFEVSYPYDKLLETVQDNLSKALKELSDTDIAKIIKSIEVAK